MKLFLLSIAAVLVVFPVFAQSWTQLNPHDDLFSSTIFATTVDKTGKVYAAAKAADGSNRYVVSVLSSGSWDPVGGVQALKANSTIYALAADSVGNIYAGGMFYDSTGNYFIARWDGSHWSELGSGTAGFHPGGVIFSLAADKAGNVYAAGELTDASGKYYVWKWDGTQWSELGTGAQALGANSIIYSVTTDAAGNVYAAGQFTDAGGAYYVARWDGTAWTELAGLNANSYITTLARDNTGSIYAAGDFKDASGHQYVARWDGSGWSAVGTGGTAFAGNGTINAIFVDQSGKIDVAGYCTDAVFGNYSVWQWSGSSWAELPLTAGILPANQHINTLVGDNIGNLYAAGDFTDKNGDRFVAELSGGSWNEPGFKGLKLDFAPNGIRDMAVDTAGHVIVLLNNTDPAGHQEVYHWNGQGWYPATNVAGNALFEPTIVGVAPDSLGNIYAYGIFPDGNGVARWSDSGWVELPLPAGPQTSVTIGSIATDKKGNVYISASVNAGPAAALFRWDGSSWTSYGGVSQVYYYFVVDAAGVVYGAWIDFDWDTYNIIRNSPDGTQTSLGGGPAVHPLDANQWVHAMAFDAAGNLYAGGNFPDSAGNSYVAKWDGRKWSKLGTGQAGPAFGDGKITGIVFDNSGNLYASCQLSGSDGTVVGRWDGKTWTTFVPGDETGDMFYSAVYLLARDRRGTLFAADQDHILVADLPASVAPPVICDAMAVVGLQASADTVAVGGDVVLTAGVRSGGDSATSFLFAKDRDFLQPLGAASTDSVVTVSAADLVAGANTFYVKMQTTNNCDSVLTAVDSVTVTRQAAPDSTSTGADSVNIKAGPNPFSGSFTVMGLDASRAYWILIANSQGMHIYAAQVSGQTSMPVEGLTLKQGVYWLEVYDRATGERVRKIELLKVP